MRYKKRFTLFTFLIILNIFTFPPWIKANASLREKIKARIAQKRNDKNAKENPLISSAGDYDFFLIHDGLKRTYKVHVPFSYKKSRPTPLIFAFHGGGGYSEMMANDDYYKLISKSEKEGFIAVFPNGTSKLKSGKFATWNAGNCCGQARDNNVDDVGFVKKILNKVKKQLNIDSQKIYAIGFSNGGMFAYRLACDLADEFKAIASVAGTLNYDSCNPKRPISILHIHAKDDGIVLFNGGAGNLRNLSKVTDFTSVPENISSWVDKNKCPKSPERILQKDGAYCEIYTECDENVEVQLCVTETGGHSWPGALRKPRKKAATPSMAISAPDEMWDFFKNQR